MVTRTRFATKLAVSLGCTAAMLWASPVGADLDPDQVEVDTPVYHLEKIEARPAETWSYSFAWTGIPVGTVRVTSHTEPAAEDSGPRLFVKVSGATNSFIDFFWRYRLYARGSTLLEPFRPGQYYAEEIERSKRKFTKIVFTPDRGVYSRRQRGDDVSEYSFPAPNTYDMLSTVFMALSFDYELGDHFVFDTLTGASRYLVSVDVRAREPIMVLGSSVDAYRLLLDTRALTDPEDDRKHRQTDLWVSAAKPRRMLQAKSRTYVGSVSVKLESIAEPSPEDHPADISEVDSALAPAPPRRRPKILAPR